MKVATLDSHEELLTCLSNGMSHYALYGAEHPMVQQTCTQFVKCLAGVLRDTGRQKFAIQVVGGQIVHNGLPLIGATIRGRRLVELVRSLSSGGVIFSAGLKEEELTELFEVGRDLGGRPVDLDESRERLELKGISHIELPSTGESSVWYDDGSDGKGGGQGGAPVSRSASEWAALATSPEVKQSIPVYQSMLDTVEASLSLVASGETVDVNEARTVSEELELATRGGFHGMMQLARHPDYDTYTVGHSIRVALYGVCVGSRLGVDPEFLTELGAAGLLHDVGKAKVPYEILYKPARLDDEERRIMSRHPFEGAQILLDCEDASRLAIGAAWGHHLRHDGGGYPARHDWVRTSKVTSLLQVCDVFEALTARRPYKPAFSARRAYEVMLGDRHAFDPWALSAFVNAVGLYPPGCCVLLSDDRKARVMYAGERIDQPCIRTLGEEELIHLGKVDQSDLGVIRVISEDELATGDHASAEEQVDRDLELRAKPELDPEPEPDVPEWPIC